MQKAVFLDRDGVLTIEKGFLHSAEEMALYEYGRECVVKLHEAGYLVFVITNQSGVSRGYFTEDELNKMNARLIDESGVDAVYYCPHHVDGIVKKYAVPCDCRKPNTGLIEKASKDYCIDLKGSYFIGDRECDIQTGKNAGIKTILVRTGYGAEEEKRNIHPDYVVDDLKAATDICINNIMEGESR